MVRVMMIVEMAGRPAAHLTESLEKHVSILREVKDATVHGIRVSEPRVIPVEEGKEVAAGEEMFTAFAECDFELPTFSRMSETMFDFMPSSIEVVEPTKVSLEMVEATDLLNNISGRLHRYDEIAKIAGERLRQMVSDMQSMQRILIARDKEIADLRAVYVDVGERAPPTKEEVEDLKEKKAAKKKVTKKVKKRIAKKKNVKKAKGK